MLVKLSFINKIIHIHNNTFNDYKGRIDLSTLTDDQFEDVVFILLNKYHNRGIETDNKVVKYYAKKVMNMVDTYIKEVRSIMRKAKRLDTPKAGTVFVNFDDTDYFHYLSLLKMIKRDINYALNGDTDTSMYFVQQYTIPQPRISKKG